MQIAEPDVTDIVQPPPVEELPPRKQFTANVAKRLSGRAAVVPAVSSSRVSIGSQVSLENLASLLSSPAQLAADDSRGPTSSPPMRAHLTPLQLQQQHVHHQHQHQHQHRHRSLDQISGRLLAQVAAWIEHEKAKKESRRSRRVHSRKTKSKSPPVAEEDAKHKPEGKGRPSERHSRVGSNKDAAEEDDDDEEDENTTALATSPRHRHRRRAPSVGSTSSEVSLDRLQRILDDNMAALGMSSAGVSGSGLSMGGGRRPSRSVRYQPSRTASSDTEYVDGDVLVPGCDAVLDNSKTLKYAAVGASASPHLVSSSGGGGVRTASDAGSVSGRHEEKERLAWVTFKNEIIRLAHTLRLKGWRKVPLDAGETISVQRLSGALTNAVYVVSPPPELASSVGGRPQPSPLQMPSSSGVTPSSSGLSLLGGSSSSSKRATPDKLLLRIYGPQVEHLIDREKELSVLRRLARKKIGPRLLGTFGNGRFEQFFTATTLTAANLREPETSKQIAKRMRELHDGIELLTEELDGGPNVWLNWDRWLDSVEKTIAFLDGEVQQAAEGEKKDAGASPFIETWGARGYVCGVAWPAFKALLAKHRELVKNHYGGTRRIRERLVFAHNDVCFMPSLYFSFCVLLRADRQTQYGNILRIRPDERSPLLQPDNEHKQLVVIDFEYAAANPPGVEFANHFTEWTYNYHDPVAPHACFPQRYPTPEQQRRFIRAYVDHRPDFPHQSASSTPRFGPMSLPPLTEVPSGPSGAFHAPLQPTSSASSIVDFMLDARVPVGGWVEEERRREELLERQVDELVAETRLWRAANSAMWVAWGIVQAKIPGFSLTGDDKAAAGDDSKAGGDGGGDDADKQEEEAQFDYLAYAQERALFVLGDCVQAGLVRLEDLPADVQTKVKRIDW